MLCVYSQLTYHVKSADQASCKERDGIGRIVGLRWDTKRTGLFYNLHHNFNLRSLFTTSLQHSVGRQ